MEGSFEFGCVFVLSSFVHARQKCIEMAHQFSLTFRMRLEDCKVER